MGKWIISIIVFLPNICFGFCFNEAGQMYNINANLLWSIAKVESNFNPKAINKNSNGTYDFGVMQINSSWKRVLGDKKWQHLSDPCYNVKIGAWILANCIKKHDYTWEAVGCYNAQSKIKRKKYYTKIYNTLIRYSPQYAYKGD